MSTVNPDGVLQDNPPLAPTDPANAAIAQSVQPLPSPITPGTGNRPMPLPQYMLPGGGQPQAPPIGPPKIKQDPESRMDLWRNLLGDFVWSLASGAEAGAKAPPGQRNRAAFAGALRGPYNRREAEQKLQLEKMRAEELQAQAEKAMAAIGQLNVTNAQKDQQLKEQAVTHQNEMDRFFALLEANKPGKEAATRGANAGAALKEDLLAHPKPIIMGPGQTALPGGKDFVPGVAPIYKSPAAPQKLDDNQRAVAAYIAHVNAKDVGYTDKAFSPDEAGFLKWRESIKPRSDQVVVMRTTDDQGNAVNVIVPKVPGVSYPAAPTAQEDNRRYQADIIDNYATHIISLIDKNPETVGPILGRIAKGETAIGNVSPEAKAIGTALGSFTALQPILHGFRGGSQTVDHFNAVLGDQHLNAAALKASLKEIQFLAQTIKNPPKAKTSASGIRRAVVGQNGSVTIKK